MSFQPFSHLPRASFLQSQLPRPSTSLGSIHAPLPFQPGYQAPGVEINERLQEPTRVSQQRPLQENIPPNTRSDGFSGNPFSSILPIPNSHSTSSVHRLQETGNGASWQSDPNPVLNSFARAHNFEDFARDFFFLAWEARLKYLVAIATSDPTLDLSSPALRSELHRRTATIIDAELERAEANRNFDAAIAVANAAPEASTEARIPFSGYPVVGGTWRSNVTFAPQEPGNRAANSTAFDTYTTDSEAERLHAHPQTPSTVDPETTTTTGTTTDTAETSELLDDDDDNDNDSSSGQESRKAGDDCSICLLPMYHHDPIARLGCHESHVFHAECLKHWLETCPNHRTTCPACRTEIKRATWAPYDADRKDLAEGARTLVDYDYIVDLEDGDSDCDDDAYSSHEHDEDDERAYIRVYDETDHDASPRFQGGREIRDVPVGVDGRGRGIFRREMREVFTWVRPRKERRGRIEREEEQRRLWDPVWGA